MVICPFFYQREEKETEIFTPWLISIQEVFPCEKTFHQKSICQSHQNSKAPVDVSILHVMNLGLEDRCQHRSHLELSLSSWCWKPGQQKCEVTEQRGLERPCGKFISETCRQNRLFFFKVLGAKTQKPLFIKHSGAITTWTSQSSFPYD